MIENADEVVNCIAEKIREILRTKESGTFGITITMHEGQPLKICEQNEINLLRRPGNRAALYDEFIAKETEKGLINEHVEHRKCFMAMIYYFGRSPTRQAASGRAFRGSALTRFIAPLRSATANAAPTIPNVGSDG